MQRRDLFKLVASGAVLGPAAVLVETGCQRASKPNQSFVTELRSHELPDTVEPAFAFRPLKQPAK